MPVAARRELIVEFERVQIVRRRAKTRMRTCAACGTRTDFITLGQAARLFEMPASDILRFVRENSCHFEMDPAREVHLCLAALMERMRERSCGVRLELASYKEIKK
jgi:hypothetical protein